MWLTVRPIAEHQPLVSKAQEREEPRPTGELLRTTPLDAPIALRLKETPSRARERRSAADHSHRPPVPKSRQLRGVAAPPLRT